MCPFSISEGLIQNLFNIRLVSGLPGYLNTDVLYEVLTFIFNFFPTKFPFLKAIGGNSVMTLLANMCDRIKGYSGCTNHS